MSYSLGVLHLRRVIVLMVTCITGLSAEPTLKGTIPSSPVSSTPSSCSCLRLGARLKPSYSDSGVIIWGWVVGPSGSPVRNALVTIVSAKDHSSIIAHTNDSGRFTLHMGRGGEYLLTIDAPGLARIERTLVAVDGQTIALSEVQMAPAITTLQAVNTRAKALRPDLPGSAAAGASEAFVPTERADRFVADRNSLEAIALLVPGATLLIGSDGSPDYSVGGASASQNALTLDGATSSSTIPRDAIAGAVLTTGTADVSRGRFGGGQIAAWTMHGSTARRNAMRVSGTDPLLQAGDGKGPLSTEYRDIQLSGTSSGPIGTGGVYYFGAAQLGQHTNSLASYVDASRARLALLGLSADSVVRLAEIANRIGIPSQVGDRGDRVMNSASTLFDVTVTQSEQSSIDLRINGSLAYEHPLSRSFTASPSSALDARHGGGDIHIGWTSLLDSRVLNSFQSTASVVVRRATPLLPSVPAAVVRLAQSSESGVPLLMLGGSGTGSFGETQVAWETTNESTLQDDDAKHRIKFGEFFRVERQQTSASGNPGTFGFASLANFEAGTPDMFTRTVGSTSHGANGYSGAVYVGDRWRAPIGRLDLEYGARFEADRFAARTLYIPQVDSLFALRTGRQPSEWRVSPRVGFTLPYGHGPYGSSFGNIRVGLGEYRGVIPLNIIDQVSGLDEAETTVYPLVCAGAAAPRPAWTAYLAGQRTAAQCADGSLPTQSDATPDASGFAQGYAAPRSWRATSTLSGAIAGGVVFGIDGLYSLGLAQPSTVDLNLRKTGGFALPAEGGRSVYSSLADVLPNDGLIVPSASRVDQRYRHVWDNVSDLRTEATQFTARVDLLPGFVLPGAWQIAYTWSRIRDQARGYDEDTGGDPTVPGWARSPLERRHQLLVTATLPANRWFTSYLTGRFASGVPYSPLVSSDINGDGLANDRAFIFTPQATDTVVGSGMRRLLSGGSPASARNCLESQIGTIAVRNSCFGPWTGSLDLQATLRPERLGFDNRVSATIRIVNLLAGLDEWVHGSSHLHGWGGSRMPDPILLTPVGFDAGEHRFRYVVNPRFGRSDLGSAAGLNPFEIAADVHIAIGPDPRRAELLEIVVQKKSTLTPDAVQLKARVVRRLPDPFHLLLLFADSLKLTREQITQITTMQTAYNQEADELWDPLFAELATKQVANLNLGSSMGRINETAMEVQRRQIRWGHALRSIMSSTQQSEAPLYVKHVMFDDESVVEPLIR
jgi:hypothetical protein